MNGGKPVIFSYPRGRRYFESKTPLVGLREHHEALAKTLPTHFERAAIDVFARKLLTALAEKPQHWLEPGLGEGTQETRVVVFQRCENDGEVEWTVSPGLDARAFEFASTLEHGANDGSDQSVPDAFTIAARHFGLDYKDVQPLKPYKYERNTGGHMAWVERQLGRAGLLESKT
ncbi:MAG: hypothetical protein EBQ89_04695 [Alphaproteobacteria bacterium]|nr:hypothetical protein [Alphaproteobacteria bacterium]